MTKRYGDPISKNSCKKSKIEEDFWDDGLDDALDRIATQVCEEEIYSQQKTDVSILPSYGAFKQSSRHIMSSTQKESSFVANKMMPSTSHSRDTNVQFENSNTYALNMVELKRKCEEKEGEVTVLRNQMKQLKANFQQDNEKRHQEWSETIKNKEKQVKTFKDQLDFKNLEIAHLKQKIVDVGRRANLDITLNGTQNFSQQLKTNMHNKGTYISNSSKKITSKAEHNNIIEANCTIKTVTENIYPLKKLVSPVFPLFESYREEGDVSSKHVDMCADMQIVNKYTNSGHVIFSRFVQTLHSSKIDDQDMEIVYHSVTSLLNCTLEEINSDLNKPYVNQILCYTLKSLDTLNEYLNNLLQKAHSEEVQLLDDLYLTNEIRKMKITKSDQLAVKTGRCMYILSELLLCCRYLQGVILLDKAIQADSASANDGKFTNNKSRLLDSLFSITSMLGQLRLGHLCTDFQIGTATFLSSIGRTNQISEVGDVYCKIVKQMIFSRPNSDVMPHIIDLLMIGSKNNMFVESLCNKLPQSNVIKNLKKGTVTFNEDSCMFHVFVVLVNKAILNADYLNYGNLETCLRLLRFSENVIQSNCHWIYHKEEKRCECLEQFYKLMVELIYNVLCKYKETSRKVSNIAPVSETMMNFFKYSIRILNLLTFNSYDLIEKFATVFSQFREIIHSFIELTDRLLLDENDLNDLKKLNVNEDTFSISSGIIEF